MGNEIGLVTFLAQSKPSLNSSLWNEGGSKSGQNLGCFPHLSSSDSLPISLTSKEDSLIFLEKL